MGLRPVCGASLLQLRVKLCAAKEQSAQCASVPSELTAVVTAAEPQSSVPHETRLFMHVLLYV